MIAENADEIQDLCGIITEVVGVDHYPGRDNIPLQNTELVLWRDPNNEADFNAIQVRSLEGDLVGYIRKELAPQLSQLLRNDTIHINHLKVFTFPQSRPGARYQVKIRIGIFGFQSKRADVMKVLQQNRFLDPKASEYTALSQSARKRHSDGHVSAYQLEERFHSGSPISIDVPSGDTSELDEGSRILLFSILLMSDYTVKKSDQKSWISLLQTLSKAFKSLNPGTNVRIRPFNEYLTVRTDGSVTFLSKRQRDQVIDFIDSPEYVRVFLTHADQKAIKEYCRTSKPRSAEKIIRIDSELNEKLVNRIGVDILNHPTIEDSSIHQLVSEKLHIPLEILSLGRDGFSSFIELLKKGSSEISHAQVMILGCGGVGKTTLLKRLTTEQSIEDIRRSTDSTIGVDIRQAEAKTLKALNSKERETLKVDLSKVTAKERDIEEEIPPDSFSDTTLKKKSMKSKMPISSSSESCMEQEEKWADGSVDLDRGENEDLIQSKDTHDSLPVSEATQGTSSFTGNDDPKSKTILNLVSALVRREGDVDETIDFYDFAGQYVYYSTHQLYLSRAAFYILVTDMSRKWEEKPGMLENRREHLMYRDWTNEKYLNFWLESIQAFSREDRPSVILIGTHAEGKSDEEKHNHFVHLRAALKSEGLFDLLSDDREFFVSFDSEDNLDEIRRCIKAIAKDHSNWSRRVPNIYTLFQEKFKAIQDHQKVMAFENVMTLQEDFPVDIRLEKENQIKFMLKFFHEIGLILYFDCKDVNKYVILDVKYFTNAFKRIITVRSNTMPKVAKDFPRQWITFHEKGELPDALLDAIWSNEGDPTTPSFKAHKRELLLYMKELCFLTEVKAKNGSLLVVPCMNTVPFSSGMFKNHRRTSVLCFQFPALAGLIFHRLVTCCANTLWPISMERRKSCIFQNVMIFEHRDRFIAVGSVHDTIQLQIFDSHADDKYTREKSNTKVNIEVKEAIVTRLQEIVNIIGDKFPFTCGYKCKATTFCDENNDCFIPETGIDWSTEYMYCESCPMSERERINVLELVSYWKKSEDKESDIDAGNAVVAKKQI
ncbi:uncharacterized protein LOC125654653 isoform X4 [Ostrea edulis]|uniref:uncharacterized protein LOC125654653 isoform X4 n=1 Tax=Ostrea edulis TaxID=37623 RepID=UPI0024AFFA71|nr:uncharacterized protein LOC125654653 isoform X4 [Ostrea edulis]